MFAIQGSWDVMVALTNVTMMHADPQMPSMKEAIQDYLEL